MSGFPYGTARGLGGVQIFLGVAAMGLGAADVVMGTTWYFGHFFRFYMLATGTWTGLFFLIAGSLAASISEGRAAGCKIVAAQTMSLINAIIFAPGLATVSALSAVENYWFYGIYDQYYYKYPSHAVHVMFYLESALAVVGGLEFIFSIATASVCCCGGSYDQPAANQVVPMPVVAYPWTPMQQPAVPMASPAYGFAQSTSVPAGAATGGDGQMVTLPAAELGLLYAKANNSAAE